MKNSNPFNIYKDVIGAKVFYKGCPDEGANLTKQIEKIRKEKELNRQ